MDRIKRALEPLVNAVAVVLLHLNNHLSKAGFILYRHGLGKIIYDGTRLYKVIFIRLN